MVVLHLSIEVHIPVLLIHQLVAVTYIVITSLLKLAYTLGNKEVRTALKRFLLVLISQNDMCELISWKIYILENVLGGTSI